MRDLDGRTYAAATVDLPSLRSRRSASSSRWRSPSGAKGARGRRRADRGTRSPRPTWPRCATSPDPGVPVHRGDPHGSGAGHQHDLDRPPAVSGRIGGVGTEHHGREHQPLEVDVTVSVTGDDAARGRRCDGCGRRTTPSRRAHRCGWPSAPPTCSGLATATETTGLDVSGLDGVDRASTPRARTADVQGMCTYEDLVDATLPHGLIPLVVPAAAHDHPGRRGDRARHRVDLVPQRAAARVGARDGHLHRRRRGRHGHAATTSTPSCSRRSPTPTARSATRPGCASSSSRSPPTSRCATSGSTTPTPLQDAIAAITETGEWHGERVDAIDGSASSRGSTT